MIMLPNGPLITAISLPMRVANENLFFALNLSPSRPHNGNLPIHLLSFYPYTPQLNPRVKTVPAHRNRFTFLFLGYKLPHRHCNFSIGQSLLPCLLPPLASPKTPAFPSSPEQMASNKHVGEGSSDAPPLLRPHLG
jgi:hypothetical protein